MSAVKNVLLCFCVCSGRSLRECPSPAPRRRSAVWTAKAVWAETLSVRWVTQEEAAAAASAGISLMWAVGRSRQPEPLVMFVLFFFLRLSHRELNAVNLYCPQRASDFTTRPHSNRTKDACYRCSTHLWLHKTLQLGCSLSVTLLNLKDFL